MIRFPVGSAVPPWGLRLDIFVQLRFPGADGWATVAVDRRDDPPPPTRAQRSSTLETTLRRQAVEVRIVSEQQLRGRGANAVDAALESLARHGDPSA